MMVARFSNLRFDLSEVVFDLNNTQPSGLSQAVSSPMSDRINNAPINEAQQWPDDRRP